MNYDADMQRSQCYTTSRTLNYVEKVTDKGLGRNRGAVCKIIHEV